MKRSIGHLCHDEPRESNRVQKHDVAVQNNRSPIKQEQLMPNLLDLSFEQQQADQKLPQGSGTEISPRSMVSAAQVNDPPFSVSSSGPPGQFQEFGGYGDWSLGSQNQFQGIHSYHPSYMFSANDITNEYNLLNEFLSSSLLEDGTLFPTDDAQTLNSDPSLSNTLAASVNSGGGQPSSSQHQSTTSMPDQASVGRGDSIPPPKSARPADKEEEKYYMNIADPSGNDNPEERMRRLLKAKYNAGMLRPFNYILGYARLDKYMDQNMQPASRHKILRQLEKFRPKFRERMHRLTDMELTMVEMWFERTLMEYDRVFASMAIPACCWRRTGEIFRGNKEMAELIHVPIEKLRDVSFAPLGWARWNRN